MNRKLGYLCVVVSPEMHAEEFAANSVITGGDRTKNKLCIKK